MHPWIGLSDEIRLGLLTQWVTPELVDEVLAECGKRDARPRPLSSRLMVYYVLALALFQQDRAGPDSAAVAPRVHTPRTAE
jgi:hypothetical protein